MKFLFASRMTIKISIRSEIKLTENDFCSLNYCVVKCECVSTVTPIYFISFVFLWRFFSSEFKKKLPLATTKNFKNRHENFI